MKSALAIVLFLFTAQIKKNDPNGTWVSEPSGTQYTLTLKGSELHVEMVEGSNPRFTKYEVTLKNQDEVNTYKGSGYFVAKLEDGKECKFDTEWLVIVVATNTIVGSTSNIVPDSKTCTAKERTQAGLDLKKK